MCVHGMCFAGENRGVTVCECVHGVCFAGENRGVTVGGWVCVCVCAWDALCR